MGLIFPIRYFESTKLLEIVLSEEAFDVIQTVFFQAEDLLDVVVFKAYTEHELQEVFDFREKKLIEYSEPMLLSMREMNLIKTVIDCNLWAKPMGHGEYQSAYTMVIKDKHRHVEQLIQNFRSFFEVLNWVPDEKLRYSTY